MSTVGGPRLAVVLSLVLFSACSRERVFGSPENGGSGGNGGNGNGGLSSEGDGAAGGVVGSGSTPGVGGESNEMTVSVVSSDPVDGAKGVLEGATVQIVFSAPMDQASVEEAYSSGSLASDQVVFSWSSDSTILTVTPKAPLAYGIGSGTAYGLEIDVSAKAANGAPLDEVFALEFSTARLVATNASLSQQTTKTGFWRSSGDQGSCPGYEICVGDGLSDTQYKSFFTFGLGVPEGSIGVHSAELTMPCNYLGNPFSTLGSLVVEHVEFETVGTAAFSAAALGTVATTATKQDSYAFDATDAVKDDFAEGVARGGLSQYRLSFSTLTDSDGSADLCRATSAQPLLAIQYLVP